MSRPWVPKWFYDLYVILEDHNPLDKMPPTAQGDCPFYALPKKSGDKRMIPAVRRMKCGEQRLCLCHGCEVKGDR